MLGGFLLEGRVENLAGVLTQRSAGPAVPSIPLELYSDAGIFERSSDSVRALVTALWQGILSSPECFTWAVNLI